MGLNFIGDVGVYLPSRDAVKITAIDGDRVIDCYATRSALEAVGCPGPADGPELIRHFQRHRDNLELAAIVNAIANAIPGEAGSRIDMPATPAKVWAAVRTAAK